MSASDSNTVMIKTAMAALVMKAGGKLRIEPGDLGALMGLDVDLTFTFTDDGCIEFTLVQVPAKLVGVAR